MQALEATLRLYLMGRTRVFAHGNEVTARIRPKSLGLLKAVADSGTRGITRDHLAEMFWPDSDPDAAYLSLKVAAHNLRRALGSSAKDERHWLTTQRGTYRLGDAVWVDSREFDRHVRSGRAAEAAGRLADARADYRSALELYAGDYLEDDLYEDWALMTRERLRDEYLDLLGRLLADAIAEADHALAVAYAHRILRIDPCREDVYRLLMRSHVALGQLSRAGAWYAVARQAMRRELDTDVSSETKAMFLALFPAQPEHANRGSGQPTDLLLAGAVEDDWAATGRRTGRPDHARTAGVELTRKLPSRAG